MNPLYLFLAVSQIRSKSDNLSVGSIYWNLSELQNRYYLACEDRKQVQSVRLDPHPK